MKYSTIKRMELLLFFAFGVVLVGTSLLPLKHGFFGDMMTWLVPVIIITILVATTLLYLEHIVRKNYPQWERLWRVPPIAIIVDVVLIAVIIGIEFYLTAKSGDDHSVAWIIFVAFAPQPLTEYHYTRKFGLDQLHTLEELLQVHPEARDKLRKVVLGG